MGWGASFSQHQSSSAVQRASTFESRAKNLRTHCHQYVPTPRPFTEPHGPHKALIVIGIGLGAHGHPPSSTERGAPSLKRCVDSAAWRRMSAASLLANQQHLGSTACTKLMMRSATVEGVAAPAQACMHVFVHASVSLGNQRGKWMRVGSEMTCTQEWVWVWVYIQAWQQVPHSDSCILPHMVWAKVGQ